MDFILIWININICHLYRNRRQMRKKREKKDFEKIWSEFWIVQNTINENPIKLNRLNSFFGFWSVTSLCETSNKYLLLKHKNVSFFLVFCGLEGIYHSSDFGLSLSIYWNKVVFEMLQLEIGRMQVTSDRFAIKYPNLDYLC